jgi:hypothetical protein
LVPAVTLSIALPAYHSERLLIPLTVFALGLKYRQKIFSSKLRQFVITGLVLAVAITIPTLMVATTPGFLARASGLNIFSQIRQKPAGAIDVYSGILDPVVNGSWFLSSREFASLYLSYFSPRFMFNLGDYGLRTSFPELATFFVWEFHFYLLGLFFLFRSFRQENMKDLRWFICFLLLTAPLPAAITRDPYTTIRALPLVIPQTILVGLGLIQVFNWLKGKKILLGYSGFGILVLYSVFQLYSSVIILNEFYRGVEWDYGLQEVAVFLKNTYTKIPTVVDNSRDEEYIQLAFFLKYDPAKYQAENFEVTQDEYYTNMSSRFNGMCLANC